MFDVVEENLFPRSLTGATIQDGGTRERRDVLLYKVVIIFRNYYFVFLGFPGDEYIFSIFKQ